MRHSITQASIALLISASGLVACGDLSYRDQRTLTVKVTGKSDESPFFTRLATQSSHIVVTDDLPQQNGTDVVIPPGHDLYVIEVTQETDRLARNEVFREGRVILFTARDEREAYIIAGVISDFAHPRKVDTSVLKHPSAIPSRVEALTVSSDPLTGIRIDSAKMREDLESISGARPVIIDGQSVTLSNRASSDNKAKARSWLRANYEALGFTVTEHRYASGVNLVAEKRPTVASDDQIFVVSGHMDTVQTAGADDDGSGVISSLTVARALAATPLKRTIRFVAFDEEERGLIGSAAYADSLVKSGEISKVSVFNIEMTGYDSDNDGQFHTIDCDENTSGALSDALMAAISRESIALRKHEACTNRSDHAVFWEHNRPAIVISQNFFGGDSNPCYHRSCDNTQKVNWDYMTKMTNAAANAIANINGAR